MLGSLSIYRILPPLAVALSNLGGLSCQPGAESENRPSLSGYFDKLPVVASFENQDYTSSIWIDRVSLCRPRTGHEDGTCIRGSVLNGEGKSKVTFDIELSMASGILLIYDGNFSMELMGNAKKSVLQAVDGYARQYAQAFLDGRPKAAFKNKQALEEGAVEVVPQAFSPYDVWVTYDCPDVPCTTGKSPSSLAVGSYDDQRVDTKLRFPNASLQDHKPFVPALNRNPLP
jgi:hypothetical protein